MAKKGIFLSLNTEAEEVQKFNALSDQLNSNIPKGYYAIFSQWHQKHIHYLSLL